MRGLIVKGIGGFYFVYDGSSTFMGTARGILKRGKKLLYVGDEVEYELNGEECVITSVCPRRNVLSRPPVSNLDMLVVTFAAADPDVNFPVIDRLIAACESKKIDVVVCITKEDRVSEKVLEEYLDTYRGIYPAVSVNGITGRGTDALADIIKGRKVALAGPSGVGKSTILNHLVGEGSAETGTVSDRTGRGRHTTRHVEIFPLVDGTLLYDTPGFTSLDMTQTELEDPAMLFPEIRQLADQCRYSDCIHVNEPDCAVKEAVLDGRIAKTRYGSYCSILEEVKQWHK